MLRNTIIGALTAAAFAVILGIGMGMDPMSLLRTAGYTVVIFGAITAWFWAISA